MEADGMLHVGSHTHTHIHDTMPRSRREGVKSRSCAGTHNAHEMATMDRTEMGRARAPWLLVACWDHTEKLARGKEWHPQGAR